VPFMLFCACSTVQNVDIHLLQAEDAGRQAFLNLAGEDGEIDAYELQNILNQVFIRGMAEICS